MVPTLSIRQVVERLLLIAHETPMVNNKIHTDYQPVVPLPVIVYNAVIEHLKGLNRQMVVDKNNDRIAMDVICIAIMDIYHKPICVQSGLDITATTGSTTFSSLGNLLGLCPHTKLKYNPMVNKAQSSDDVLDEKIHKKTQHHPFANRIMIPMINREHTDAVTKKLSPAIAERVTALLLSDNKITIPMGRLFQAIRPLRVISLDTESRAILKTSTTSDRMKTTTTGEDKRQYRLLEAVFTEFEWNTVSQSYEYIKGNRKQLYVRPPEGELYETTQTGHLVHDAIEKGVSETRFCQEVIQHLQEKRQYTPFSDDLLLLCYNLPHERDVFASIGKVCSVGSQPMEIILFGGDDTLPLVHVEDLHKTIQYATVCQGLKSRRLKDVWEAMVSSERSPMFAQYAGTNGAHADSKLGSISGWHRATTDSRAVFEIWAVINGHSMR
jgi:hypothetical protein